MATWIFDHYRNGVRGKRVAVKADTEIQALEKARNVIRTNDGRAPNGDFFVGGLYLIRKTYP